MSPESTHDANHPAYRDFRECIAQGASWQDIHGEATHGFGLRKGSAPAGAEAETTIDELTRTEFCRVREHTRNLVEPLARHFGLERRRVLDFGCGTGALSVAMGLAGAKVTALDPDLPSLRATRHRALYFGVLERVATVAYTPQPELPFADCSFELVITNSVMEFIPTHRDAYVAELLRVLRPGGLLVVSTENGAFPYDYYTHMPLPRLRRRTAQARNWPYGLTWKEIRRWARMRPDVQDLSPQNRFNSLDKLTPTLRSSGHPGAAGILDRCNRAFRALCRACGVPSDVFLPYATFVFRVQAHAASETVTSVAREIC